MAVASFCIGTLIGYKYFEREGVQYHTYHVLVEQKPDQKTKLCEECAVCSVNEKSQVLGDKLVKGLKVQFQSEPFTRSKQNGGGSGMRYYGIEPV